MITEPAIRSAIKNAPLGGKKAMELRDEGEGGGGRLAIIIGQLSRGVTAEWYAVAWRDGRRKMTKLGTYPAVPLADARKRFREDFAPAISAGEALPSGPRSRAGAVARAATVEALFDAYIASLKRAGKVSWRCAEPALARAAASIGKTKIAATVEAGNITPILGEIHARGAIVMARGM